MEREDLMMVNFEIEAAEALAEFARCCSQPSQDPEMDIQHSCGFTSNTVADAGKYAQCSGPDSAASGYQSNSASKLSPNSDKNRAIGARKSSGNTSDTVPENRKKIIPAVPSQPCAGNKSNSTRRSKRNTNEAEKEAQRLRRVLANRESARQTIRRRQAMYLELSGKAADLLEENKNLKKEKEIAVKDYNSVKDTNKFLKAQVSKIEEAERREAHKQPNSSQTEAPSSAPMLYHNQHPFIPCFWPSILPTSNIFQHQCASHLNAMTSPQLLMPNWSQGQENSGTPVFVLPVPWLLPFQTHNTNVTGKEEKLSTQQFRKCSTTDGLLHEDNIRLSLDLNVGAEVYDSSRSMSMTDVYGAATQFTSPRVTPGGPTGNFQPNNASLVSASADHMMWSKENRVKKPEDSFEASEARRKRKELMKLKNVNCA